MKMRALAFVIAAVDARRLHAGKGRSNRASEAGWKQRDKQLMSNLPYSAGRDSGAISVGTSSIITRKEAPGTIVIDSDNKFLYYVLPQGKAIRYGIAVGEEAQAWSGIAKVGRMEEWPPWIPTPGEQQRLGPLPAYRHRRPAKSDGRARHVSVIPATRTRCTASTAPISPNISVRPISSGCIRMTNEDAIDLYKRVKVGTPVVVLGPHGNGAPAVEHVASGHADRKRLLDRNQRSAIRRRTWQQFRFFLFGEIRLVTVRGPTPRRASICTISGGTPSRAGMMLVPRPPDTIMCRPLSTTCP